MDSPTSPNISPNITPADASVLAPQSSAQRTVQRFAAGQRVDGDDHLAEEVPIALEYNGISHAVMMATPADLEDFALGFSLSEGILADPGECYGIDVDYSGCGITVQLEVATRAFAHLKERRRSMSGRTGCGLCGVDTLDQVYRKLPALTPDRALSAPAIRHALDALRGAQSLARLTGATHAAAWCDSTGQPQAVFEDVGRHNALDKLVGMMARKRMGTQDGFVLITSRASVEMVQKAAMAGIAGLVAISAPTAAAARLAEECGMTLVAFARGADFVCYANAHDRLFA
jgi:FdhD protein